MVDLAGGFLGVEQAGEEDTEAEMVLLVFGIGVVTRFAVACQIGYAGFGEQVASLDVEPGGGVVVEV